VYEDALTAKLLLRLKTMQYTPDIDPATHHWVSAWVQAVEQELFNLDLEAKRTALRQTVDNTWFQIQGKSYTADSLLQVLLPEEQDRQLRVEAGNHLVHLAQQIEPQMREAMLKANTLWQQCGFVNAIPPKLRTIGVSETLVRQVIVTLEKMTRDIAQSTLNEYEDLLGHEVTPWEWHYAVKTLMQPFEESLKEENVVQGVQRTFRGIGLDLEQLPIQFIEAPASAGVQVFPVRIPSDIRIRHGMQQGYRGYRRWLKALGEACYYAHIDAKQAYAFRRYAPGVLADGLATLSSWVLWEPAWLEEFTHMSSEQISICSEQMKRYELLKWRYDAGLALFEMDAYRVLAEDPEANLDQLYGKHLEKFLRVPFEELPVWALDQRLIEPFPYFSSKALGVAIAANLAETLYKGSESLYSPKFGKIFQSALVHQGGSKLWTESLQQLTSKPITTVAMPM
jgi:hypothetical protein